MTAAVLCVSIDTECDKSADWSVRQPVRCQNVRYGVESVLRGLVERWGARFTFLLSGEVAEDPQAVDATCRLGGAEIGAHLHGEFVEPNADWSCTRTDTPQCEYPRTLEREKLLTLTRTIERVTGLRPESFRAGRFGYSESTFAFLSEQGYVVDSSVTPFWRQSFRGGITRDHWGERPEPFVILADGQGGIVEIPVTIAVPGLLRFPSGLLALGKRRELARKVLKGISGNKGRAVWLRPIRSTAGEMIRLMESVLECWRGPKPAVLNMMFHSNELMAGMSPYCQTDDDVARLRRDLDEVLGWCYRNRVGFSTLSDTARSLSRENLRQVSAAQLCGVGS